MHALTHLHPTCVFPRAVVVQAYPFSNGNDTAVKEQADQLFKIVHVGTFSTKVQALTLLFQVMHQHNTTSSRYYRSLCVRHRKAVCAVCSAPHQACVFATADTPCTNGHAAAATGTRRSCSLAWPPRPSWVCI